MTSEARESPRARRLRATQRPGTSLSGPLPAIRMGLSVTEAAALAAYLVDRAHIEDQSRLVDQLWLRTVFIEQRRRTRIAERQAFEQRADRVLAALDPRAGR